MSKCKHDWSYERVNQSYSPYERKCKKCKLEQFKAVVNLFLNKWYDKKKET